MIKIKSNRDTILKRTTVTENPSELAINAQQLSRHFGPLKAIDQLNLQVEKLNIYGFLGPNGAGKLYGDEGYGGTTGIFGAEKAD